MGEIFADVLASKAVKLGKTNFFWLNDHYATFSDPVITGGLSFGGWMQ